MTADSSEHAAWVADVQKHLAAAREPRAAGPGPESETLRSAYLELLKLCLCDLAGTATASVGALPDGSVMSRRLSGDGLRLRSAGMDWPLQGLTMVGLGRLDDLQACVESVVADGIDGDLIEGGAWRGGASILMRATLDTLGDDRPVCVADSFQGFPEVDAADSEAFRLSAIDFLAVPLEEVRENFARFGCEQGVELVPGFFEETLAGLSGRPWSIVRLDADTYQATRHALHCLYPDLTVGGYLIVDDYGSFQGCRQAVDQFREQNEITEPLQRVDFSGVRWRRESDAPIKAAPAAPAGARPPRPVSPPSRDRHVPTGRELELVRELAAIRARLAAAESEIGLRAWLRRKVVRRSR
jgi:O-methyltransferase